MNEKSEESQSRYYCSVHGDIGQKIMEVHIDDEVIGRFCIYCLNDFLIKNIGQVAEIESGKE